MKTLYSPFGRAGRLPFWLVTFVFGPVLGSVVYHLPLIVLVLNDTRDVDLSQKVFSAVAALLKYPVEASLPFAIAFLLAGWGWFLFSYFPILNVWIRRLHDLGKSGWWVLLYVSPFVALFLRALVQPVGWSEALPSFFLGEIAFYVLVGIGALFLLGMVWTLGFWKGDAESNRFGPAP